MKRVILGVFYAILFLTTGIIIFLSVAKPQNNLIPWQMAVGTVVFTAFFAGVAYFWKCKNIACNRWVKIIILISAGALLYTVGATRGLLFGGFGDYPAVYRSAKEMSTVGELSYPRYFLTYGNNVRPMLFLSVLFKISHSIGLNEYYFTLGLSVLTAVAAMWAIGKLIGDNNIYQMPAMLFVAICLPIFVFYSLLLYRYDELWCRLDCVGVDKDSIEQEALVYIHYIGILFDDIWRYVENNNHNSSFCCCNYRSYIED